MSEVSLAGVTLPISGKMNGVRCGVQKRCLLQAFSLDVNVRCWGGRLRATGRPERLNHIFCLKGSNQLAGPSRARLVCENPRHHAEVPGQPSLAQNSSCYRMDSTSSIGPKICREISISHAIPLPFQTPNKSENSRCGVHVN